MLSFDLDNTRVAIIGVAKYDADSNLDDLPAVENNLTDLEKIFLDRDIIGVLSNNISVIRNPRTASELGTQLARLARQATDCFVVYYAGHGLKARAATGLFLATVESTEADCEFNAFPLENLKLALHRSPALRKVLILDCCFSGEIIEDGMGPEASLLASDIEITGTFSLASSPANKLSVAPEGAQYTAFSEELITVLKNGTGGNEDYLTLDDIYQHVRRRILSKRNLPEPQCKSILDGNKMVFAKIIKEPGPRSLS